MKYAIFLFILLTTSITTFSQNVTVKKDWLDNAITELRTKDIWAERLAENKKTIDSLTNQVQVVTVQKVQETQKVNSLTIERAAWKTKFQNMEALWKVDRAKKRKKGVVNVLLTGVVVGLGYLYITK